MEWHQKQEVPSESIEGTTAAKGFWVPQSFTNKCSGCGAINIIGCPSPHDEKERGMFLYGDEAARGFRRDGKNYHYFCIALVAISPDIREKVQQSIERIEANVKHASKGKVHRFHAKDIMDGKNWDREYGATFRMNYIRRVLVAASTYRVTKIVMAGCASWENSTDQRRIRDQIFSGIYLYALDKLRKNKLVPVLHFDRVKGEKKNGWAEECVRGARYYPLFVWLAQGAHVPEPQFIEPGSTLESKIADALAYATAREFAKVQAGEPVDIRTSEYGAAHFAGFDGKGNLIHLESKGFPLKQIFGLDPR